MNTPIFDHEKLKAYQQAVAFVAWADELTRTIKDRAVAVDHLDRASTSVVLNLAEGNGKRSAADRCRYFDIARGSGVECAACLDVLVAKQRIPADKALEGKGAMLGVVSMIAGLIARFSSIVREDATAYGDPAMENE